jgi:hypothetical protein
MTNSLLQTPLFATAERTVQKVVLPGQTPEGEHILGVLVKRTYDIVSGGSCTRATADKKLVPGDEHYGDPMNSTVKFESDFVPFKLATDVVLHGKAYAPTGRRATTLTTSLIVGQYRKDVLILGDRVARYNGQHDPIFTDPEPFETMDLGYERAYGGVDIYSETRLQCLYPRNHLGRGYAVARSQPSVDNLPLPNIEDPRNPLTPARLCVGDFKDWERQPMPQGFGWTMKMWLPRAGYAGVMPADRPLEQELRKAYATLLSPAQRKVYEEAQSPAMDFRFFNGASAGLVLPFLSGAEQVDLRNLDPSGRIQFQLPGERPTIGLDLGQGVQDPPVVLHTVMIRMDDRQVDLVWRGAVPYKGPDWLPEMKKMEVSIE